MSDSLVNEVNTGLTGVNHETIGELHALSTGSAQLSGYHDLATLGVGLHDEAKNTIAGTSDGEATQKFVAERFTLGDGAEPTLLDLFGVY